MLDRLNWWSQTAYRHGKVPSECHIVCHPACAFARASGGSTVCSNRRGTRPTVRTRCQVNECGSTEGCQLGFFFFFFFLLGATCLSCVDSVRRVLPYQVLTLGRILTCCFFLCRSFCACLPWEPPFAWGLDVSQASSSAPQWTGSIRGPVRLCSPSATGSSKRLKALRFGHLNSCHNFHIVSASCSP